MCDGQHSQLWNVRVTPRLSGAHSGQASSPHPGPGQCPLLPGTDFDPAGLLALPLLFAVCCHMCILCIYCAQQDGIRITAQREELTVWGLGAKPSSLPVLLGFVGTQSPRPPPWVRLTCWSGSHASGKHVYQVNEGDRKGHKAGSQIKELRSSPAQLCGTRGTWRSRQGSSPRLRRRDTLLSRVL